MKITVEIPAIYHACDVESHENGQEHTQVIFNPKSKETNIYFVMLTKQIEPMRIVFFKNCVFKKFMGKYAKFSLK